MPTPSLWINPNDPELKRLVDSLQPTPGYCIFIDIAGSTATKQQGIRQWIARIHNCFSNAHLFLHPFSPLKSIGDALMYYIEFSDLRQSCYTPLQIFDGLWQIATEDDPELPVVKIGAARCEQAYALSFLQGNQDYYGMDIDMTARLLSLAKQREVVIERRFYEDIAADYRGIANQEQFICYRCLRGPTQERLKGIPNVTDVYRTAAA
jgi:class 3 adenylate cyclase